MPRPNANKGTTNMRGILAIVILPALYVPVAFAGDPQHGMPMQPPPVEVSPGELAAQALLAREQQSLKEQVADWFRQKKEIDRLTKVNADLQMKNNELMSAAEKPAAEPPK